MENHTEYRNHESDGGIKFGHDGSGDPRLDSALPTTFADVV
jgi:hypothetical protein